MKINNIMDIRRLFSKIKNPVIGIGVTAFNRLGPENFVKNYRIICLKNSREIAYIERNVDVFCLGKSEKTEGMRKNSMTVLESRKVKKTINAIKGEKYLLFYRLDKEIEKICRQNSWNIIGNPSSVWLEDKIFFRNMLKKCKLKRIPGKVENTDRLDYGRLKEKYGKFVIQLKRESGGKGTFFISSEVDFDKAMKNIRYKKEKRALVAKFIEGPSPSITGCVTRHGILCTGLQYQITDIPECVSPKKGSGAFAGHDWTGSDDFSEKVKRQAYQYAEKIGKYLKRIGYKGIFGLDMVLDRNEEQLYAVECNPRLLGSFPPLTMSQIMNSEIPVIAFHILEFMDIEYEIDLETINRMLKKPKLGAQLILHNTSGCNARNRGEIMAGVYELMNGKLEFKRSGYDLKDLKTHEEFIISDGVPFRNTLFRENERVLRLLTLHPVLDKKTWKLNHWAGERVNAVKKALNFEKLA